MKKDLILYTKNLAEAIQEIEKIGGEVPHILADDVLVAHIPESVDHTSLKNSQHTPPETLSKASADLVTAWETVLVESKKEAKHEGRSWDHKDHDHPHNAYNTKELNNEKNK